jgi:hypothetical protein
MLKILLEPGGNQRRREGNRFAFSISETGIYAGPQTAVGAALDADSAPPIAFHPPARGPRRCAALLEELIKNRNDPGPMALQNGGFNFSYDQNATLPSAGCSAR